MITCQVKITKFNSFMRVRTFYIFLHIMKLSPRKVIPICTHKSIIFHDSSSFLTLGNLKVDYWLFFFSVTEHATEAA